MSNYDPQEEQFQIHDKWNPMLIEGCKQGDLDKVIQAIQNKANLGFQDKNGWSALAWSSNNNHIEIVIYLIEKQILQHYDNIERFYAIDFIQMESLQEKQNQLQNTKSPLQLAALQGNHQICSLLIMKGFSWLFQDDLGNNCFHYACSSNSLKTVEIFLQIGVYTRSKNLRSFFPSDLTSDQEIKNLIQRSEQTLVCKITNKEFQKYQIKYLCIFCQEFVSKQGCQVQFIQAWLDIQINYLVQTLCQECQQKQIEITWRLKSLIDNRDYQYLQNFYKEIGKECSLINLPLISEGKLLLENLEQENKLQQILETTINIENYKQIKNIIHNLEYQLETIQTKYKLVSSDIITLAKQKGSSLLAERNLRHFLEYFQEGQIDYKLRQQIQELVNKAQENQAPDIYIQKANIILQKINLVLEARELIAQFENYPIREYPPEPIYDKKRKLYLDPVTNKPLDPKKPQILSINPPKKKKGKNAQEFQIPQWAENRLSFLKSIQRLQEIFKTHEELFEMSYIQASNALLLRMTKENKYWQRIELDQKLIDEINSKKKKQQIIQKVIQMKKNKERFIFVQMFLDVCSQFIQFAVESKVNFTLCQFSQTDLEITLREIYKLIN